MSIVCFRSFAFGRTRFRYETCATQNRQWPANLHKIGRFEIEIEGHTPSAETKLEENEYSKCFFGFVQALTVLESARTAVPSYFRFRTVHFSQFYNLLKFEILLVMFFSIVTNFKTKFLLDDREYVLLQLRRDEYLIKLLCFEPGLKFLTIKLIELEKKNTFYGCKPLFVSCVTIACFAFECCCHSLIANWLSVRKY